MHVDASVVRVIAAIELDRFYVELVYIGKFRKKHKRIRAVAEYRVDDD